MAKNNRLPKTADKRTPKSAVPLPGKLVHKQGRLKHEIPAGMPELSASVILVQQTGNEFHLMFFQPRLPLIIPDTPEAVKELNAIKEIPADCVARVCLSPERIPSIIKVLQSNYDAWSQNRAPGGGGDAI
jgi:hypothetical protein